MTPTLAANQAVLEELYDNLAQLLREVKPQALNWQPSFGDTNTIAALVSHLVGATDRWLSHAASSYRAGDRDAEFVAQATADDLIALIDTARFRSWQMHLTLGS